MQLILVVSAAATLLLTAAGCGSDEPDPVGGSAGAPAGGSAGAPAGGSAGAPAGGSATVTYAKDVQPIFMAKCGTCHGGQNLGNHNIATNYEDARRPAESLQFDECWDDVTAMAGPKTLGECSFLLVRAGKMPAFSACDKPQPPDPAVCLSQSEKDIVGAWVAAGMPP